MAALIRNYIGAILTNSHTHALTRFRFGPWLRQFGSMEPLLSVKCSALRIPTPNVGLGFRAVVLVGPAYVGSWRQRPSASPLSPIQKTNQTRRLGYIIP